MRLLDLIEEAFQLFAELDVEFVLFRVEHKEKDVAFAHEAHPRVLLRGNLVKCGLEHLVILKKLNINYFSMTSHLHLC